MINFVFKTALKKKATVIVAAVAMLFAVLYFAANFQAVSDGYLCALAKAEDGNSDIVVESSASKGSNLLSVRYADIDGVEWAAGSMSFYSCFENDGKVIYLRAFEPDKLDLLYRLDFVSKRFGATRDIREDDVIISQLLAVERGLSVGDGICVSLAGVPTTFYVGGIAHDVGCFFGHPDTVLAVASFVNTSLGWPLGKIYNSIHIKVSGDPAETNLKLSAVYPSATVRQANTPAVLKKQIELITTLFALSSVVLLSVVAIIIYKLFALYFSDSPAEVSKLKVIGASDTKIIIVFFCRALLIAAMGALAGACVFVPLIRGIFERYTGIVSPFTAWGLAAPILFALIIPLFAAAVPVIQASRNSIRENMAAKSINKRIRRAAAAAFSGLWLLMLILEFCLPSLSGYAGVINLVVGLGFLVAAAPVVLKLAVKPLTGAMGFGGLAAFTLSRNKHIADTSKIFVASIIVASVILNSYLIINGILNKFEESGEAKIVIGNATAIKESDIDALSSLESINNIYPLIQSDCKIKIGDTEKTVFLAGTDGNFQNLYPVEPITDIGELHRALDNDDIDSAVLTVTYNHLYGVETGDVIEIFYNGKTADYVVAGFCDTLHKNGNIVFVNRAGFAANFDTPYCTEVVIEENSSAALPALRGALGGKRVAILPMGGIIEKELSGFYKIASFYEAFSIFLMTLLAATLAASLALTYSNRTKESARYLLLGLPKRNLLLLNGLENLISGLALLLAGYVGAALLTKNLTDAMLMLDCYIPYEFFAGKVGLLALAGLIFYTLVPPLFASLCRPKPLLSGLKPGNR